MSKSLKDISIINVETKGGNTLQFFYNPTNNLVVVDLIDGAGDQRGNELVRMTLNEKKLLEHCQ